MGTVRANDSACITFTHREDWFAALLRSILSNRTSILHCVEYSSVIEDVLSNPTKVVLCVCVCVWVKNDGENNENTHSFSLSFLLRRKTQFVNTGKHTHTHTKEERENQTNLQILSVFPVNFVVQDEISYSLTCKNAVQPNHLLNPYSSPLVVFLFFFFLLI